jgi:NAD+ synthase
MNCKEEVKNICEWIKNYVDSAGAEGVVLGISGGLDSAVVGALCVQALGKSKIFGMLMPPTPRAKLLVKKLGIDYQDYWSIEVQSRTIVDIFTGIEPLPRDIEDYNLVKGNVASRFRMTGLYAQANASNCLVVGTSNKSELYIGYVTKYGDGGVDFEPIGDYLKTEVYELAEYLGIPQEIINAVPSADLWEGQTDEGELDITYEKLDSIIRILEKSPINMCSTNITKVRERRKKNLHKMQMPPCYRRDK